MLGLARLQQVFYFQPIEIVVSSAIQRHDVPCSCVSACFSAISGGL